MIPGCGTLRFAVSLLKSWFGYSFEMVGPERGSREPGRIYQAKKHGKHASHGPLNQQINDEKHPQGPSYAFAGPGYVPKNLAGKVHARYAYQKEAQQVRAPKYIDGKNPLHFPDRVHDRSFIVIGEVCHSMRNLYPDKDIKNQLYREGPDN